MKSAFPYLSGDALDLELHVVSSLHDAQRYDYRWQLQEYYNGSYRLEKESKGDFVASPRGRTRVQLDTHLLQHSGKYHIILTLEQSGNILTTQTLLNFGVAERDQLYLNAGIGLTSGIIGAVIGSLLTIVLVN